MTDDAYLQDLWNRRQTLKVRTHTNRLYQRARASRFEWREGAVKTASLIAGSVALARVADPLTVNVAIAVIFGGTCASLVFGWGGKARDGARRASDWTALERDIDAAGERAFTEQQLDAWTARAGELEAGEPAPNRPMLERAYAQACEALGVEPQKPAKWWVLRRPAVLIP